MFLRKAGAVSSTITALVIILVVVVAGVAYYEYITGNPRTAPSAFTNVGSSQSSTQSSTSSSTLSSTSSSQVSSAAQSVCGTPSRGTTTVSVSMADMNVQRFSPPTITVVVGVNNTVMWTNDDATGNIHTVTSRTGLFDSGTMAGGVTFTCTFTGAGTYDYFDRNNPSVVGTVIARSP